MRQIINLRLENVLPEEELKFIEETGIDMNAAVRLKVGEIKTAFAELLEIEESVITRLDIRYEDLPKEEGDS